VEKGVTWAGERGRLGGRQGYGGRGERARMGGEKEERWPKEKGVRWLRREE
jgi:hypothetical protein